MDIGLPVSCLLLVYVGTQIYFFKTATKRFIFDLLAFTQIAEKSVRDAISIYTVVSDAKLKDDILYIECLNDFFKLWSPFITELCIL